MNELIEYLAARKPFSKLTNAEREAVCELMSREAYEHLRAILLLAPALDEGPPPPAALRDRLLARMSAAPGPRGLGRAMSLHIPAWQAAAAFLFAMAAVWFLKKEQVRTIVTPVVQIQTDTLYREKIVWKERIVLHEKTVYRNSPVVKAAVPEASSKKESIAEEIPAGAFTVPGAGTSLKDEPALMDFFVQTK